MGLARVLGAGSNMRNLRNFRSHSGFTLIELVAVIAIFFIVKEFLRGNVDNVEITPSPSQPAFSDVKFDVAFHCPHQDQFYLQLNEDDLGVVRDIEGQEIPLTKLSEVTYLEEGDYMDLPEVQNLQIRMPVLNTLHVSGDVTLDPSLFTAVCKATFSAQAELSRLFREESPGYWIAHDQTQAEINLVLMPADVDLRDFLPQNIIDLFQSFPFRIETDYQPFSAMVVASFQGVTVGNAGDDILGTTSTHEVRMEAGGCAAMHSNQKPSVWMLMMILFVSALIVGIRIRA